MHDSVKCLSNYNSRGWNVRCSNPEREIFFSVSKMSISSLAVHSLCICYFPA
jgi:hypothetical protein